MRKNIVLWICGIIVIVVFAFFMNNKINHNDEEKKLEKIKVSEVTHSVFYTPFYVALENGYFEKYGLEIELMLVSGSDNVAASVLSGDTLIGLAGPESAIFVYNGKEKNYLQVFSGLTKRDGQFILGRKKDFKMEDLKGKEVLVGRSTGMPALSFLRALKNSGISKDEVNINYSIDFAELSGAFIGGNGDYVNLFQPLATKLEKNKNGYVLSSVGLLSDEFPYTAFYARKNDIKNNKDIFKNFTNAINDGLKYTLQNDSKKIASVIKNQFSDTDVSLLEEMIQSYKDADVWLDNPFIEEKFFNTIVELLKENKIIDNDVYYKDLVNNLYE